MKLVYSILLPLLLAIVLAFVFFSCGTEQPAGDQPTVVERADVIYPPAAIEQRVEGTVYVEMTVDKDGWVVAAMITQTDSPLLTDAALDAAVKYRFKPLNKECKVTVPFVFKLSE